MLCETCRKIFQSREWSRSWFTFSGPHHKTLEDFENAVRSNCSICCALADGRGYRVQNKVPPARTRSGHVLHYEFDSYYSGSISASPYKILRFTSSDAELDQREFMMVRVQKRELFEGQIDLEDACKASYAADGHGDPRTLRVASGWLQNCLRYHSSCPNPTGYAWLPKRLLKISTDRVNLIETSSSPVDGPYATLSHCWGSSPSFPVLTSENMTEMKLGIPSPPSLPLNFHQAILVCRALSIAYLWIDCLCIIQHGPSSKQDWTEQAAAMGQIYANGLLNISADRAACAADGFLGPRNRHLVPPQVVTDPAQQQQEENSNVYHVVDLEMARLGVGSRAPLARRGWVAQERLLALRVLHFAERQLFWECAEMSGEKGIACETFPYGIPEAEAQQAGSMAPFKLDGLGIAEWNRIVEDYSARRLTFPEKDKFVALAGVAEVVGRQHRRGEYVAGLWSGDLPLGLLWGNENAMAWENNGSLVSDAAYRAPSWSWASRDLHVSFRLVNELLGFEDWLREAEFADVIEVVSTPADSRSPFGQVHSATLRISAYVARAAWAIASSDQTPGFEVQLTEPDHAPGSSFLTAVLADGALDDPAEHRISGEGAIAALVVTVPGSMDAGLLLVPDCSAEDEYRRVGLWTSWTVGNEIAKELNAIVKTSVNIT